MDVALPDRQSDPGPVGADGRITPAFRTLVVASGLGSAIEHYDFFIYAFTAPLVFDHFFFPKMDSVASMIAVYATFAIGFIARPLGGIVFGHYGDLLGRKAILMITFILMGVTSFLIGCLPSYDSIGIWAPVILVVLRFVQGFAFGGEYMTAVALTLENSPTWRRGFFASWVNSSGVIGIISASGLITLLGAIFDREQFVGWVWRIPFLLSFVLVILGTFIRYHVDESFMFQAVKANARTEKLPLATVLRKYKSRVVLACLPNMVHSAFQYLSTVFMIGYAVRTLGMSQASVTIGPMIANIAELMVIPFLAFYSDRIGRRPFMIIGIVLAAIWFPIFFLHILPLKDPMLLIGGLVVSIGLVHGMIFAPEAAFTAELFPTEVRVSGSSMGKQFGIIFGGGIAPLVATGLMGSYGGSIVPVIIYFEVIAAMAFVGILLAPEKAKDTLD